MSEKLEKKWKDKMIGVLGAAALATIPSQIATDGSDTPLVVHDQEELKTSAHPSDFSVPFGQHPMDKFLLPISHLESSGGKNINHITVEGGMHAGDTALGKYALMPKTVKNVANMLRAKKSPLMSTLGPNFRDPEVSSLHSMNESDISKKLKQDPILQKKISRYLATHLHALHNGDLSRMAFGWRFGHNTPSHTISDEQLEGSGYVRKFRNLMEKTKPQNIDVAKQ